MGQENQELFDTLRNRVAKVRDGEVVERYLWRNKTTLLGTYDGDGNLLQRFEYTLGHAPTSFTQNGETYYLLTDHLGSPRVIADGAGQVVKTIDYDAYGNVVSDSNPGFGIPFGFAGGLKDSDTGLIRFGYRDYDPTTGRWTARDPIGFAGGDTNLYGYVLGDPINFSDGNGLQRRSSGGQMNRSPYAPGQSSNRKVKDTINFQVGTTVFTPTRNGWETAQTTQVGVGIYASICSTSASCSAENTGALPDAFSAGFKELGVSRKAGGDYCLTIGPALTLPGGAEYNTTGYHR
ncbi:hypothetical protein CF392_14705 [Tamilnaduibacter salinus]|uniref:Teneurin-like YD-shell domain-containing protein n=1 Tax=Tamilnaduibacter salinus TaxID=1484056 RepID=A0A2A2HYV3_9GAMM|nr:RHS repeat-associated core domain-containing protein [Tamilnaduibacter salinus]PAV24721.1 hypothetical protein CF392_14705 [Tamilnaduibacter salinus]